MWFSNGDCLVHFYSEHDPKKGPSLRLWLADIQSTNCRPLFQKSVCRPHQEKSRISGKDVPDPQPLYDLFIPAPLASTRDEAVRYHLTTRNFFAWMFEKPLVGIHLGDTLCSLLTRMNEWRYDSEENEDDFLAYVDEQGYTDFRDCPDHALALLYWAEVYKHAELWIDSFVHCAGMNERLVTSHELENISDVTKAMLTRANLEMAVRIDRASAALADFCENDTILNKQLRLSDASLRHLERFRTWLQGFYVQRHGYWPPHVMKAKFGKIRPLPKHTLLTMYADFRNLYAFMVNSEADPFVQPEVSRSVVDVLTTFDEAMKFVPLPHLIPHLPATDFTHGELRRTKNTFFLFRSKKAKFDGRRAAVASALMVAANANDLKVVSSSIVREYALFERQYTMEEREPITASEARMARWVLIYALLQILVSVTHAPDEVRDVEGVDYPLCAQTAGGPPWMAQRDSRRDSKRRRSQSIHSTRRVPEPEVEEFNLQKLKSEAASSPQPRSRTSFYSLTSPGPPPTLPLPSPTSAPRTPIRVEQQTPMKQDSIPRPSRIPVRVPSRAATHVFVPKQSRIPVPIKKVQPFYDPEELEDLVFVDEPEDPVSMSYLSDYDVDRMPLPLIPLKSSMRSSAAYSDPSQKTITGSPVTTVLVPSFPNTPPTSALSQQRQSLPFAEPTSIDSISDPASNTTPDEASLLSDSSSYSTQDKYVDAPLSSQVVPQKLVVQTNSEVINPLPSPRGRALTRSSIHQHSRRASSTSSMSEHSSGTEQHTVTSHITTPSIYTPSTFSDHRIVHRSRKSDPSTPQDQSFAISDLPPLPPTPSTTQSHFYTLAPEYPNTPADDEPEEPYVEGIGRTSRALKERGTTPPYPLYTASSVNLTRKRSGALASRKGSFTNFSSPRPFADFSERRPSEVSEQIVSRGTLGQISVSQRRPSESPSHDQAELHEAGKARRRRFFGSNNNGDQDNNLSTRRRGKSITSVFAGKGKQLVSPLSSPASILPAAPVTPISFESHESGSRVEKTTTTTTTTTHIRHRSSELAKQFREEIGWKRGPGWDGDVEGLLMGGNTN